MPLKQSSAYPILYRWLLAIRNRLPLLQPLLRRVNRVLGVRPPRTFSGWGMTTEHALPWDDGHDWADYRKAREEVRRLTYTGEAGVDTDSLDVLDWRHWVVSWAARYAMTFTDDGDFVECGVADGTTAYFTLAQVEAHDGAKRRMHLYDAWTAMQAEALSDSEQVQAGRYAKLSMTLTERNLARFADRLVWHPGYIPETLHGEPPAPSTVAFVHLDLNASAPTIEACTFFWDRMRPGGIFLFDDYGWLGFEDTKRAVDAFFAGRPGVMLKLPTAQAAFLKR